MSGIGSGNNGELTFLDIISIISFCVGLQNLELNITEQDINNQTQELDERLHVVVDDIHMHLQMQDKKIDTILEEIRNDKDKRFGGSDQG